MHLNDVLPKPHNLRSHYDFIGGLPFESIEAIRAAYNFSNLQVFLDLYYRGAYEATCSN